jgi:DNA polymerase-3 subunit epsilon
VTSADSSTSWMNSPMLAFDLESTGVQPDHDRVATACAAVVCQGVVGHQRDWTVAIDVDMPAQASAVNKLTTEYLRANGRPAAGVIPEIANAIRYALRQGMPVVAFNGAFDLTMLDRELRRWAGLNLVEFVGAEIRPVIDPFVLWKQVEPRRRPPMKLVNACETFGVDLGLKAHEAAADAIAATRVVYKLAQRHKRIAAMDLETLHAAQVVWRSEQCDELRAYFDKVRKPHDGVPGAWPLIPLAEASQQGALL